MTEPSSTGSSLPTEMSAAEIAQQRAGNPAPWASRIVGSGEVNPQELLANPQNWRIHPKHQQDALASVLDRVGWVQQVIVNQTTGHIVDGHLRVSLALRREEPIVPVIFVQLTEEEEALVLATIDPISALASTDRELLAALLETMPQESGDLGALLMTIAEHEGLVVPPPPSLNALAGEHGEPDASTFWPVVRMQLAPELHKRFTAILALMPGDDDPARLAALLDKLEIGNAAAPE